MVPENGHAHDEFGEGINDWATTLGDHVSAANLYAGHALSSCCYFEFDVSVEVTDELLLIWDGLESSALHLLLGVLK